MKCRMDYATSTFKFCITLQYPHFLSSSIKEERILFSDRSIHESLRLWQTTKKTMKLCKIEIHIMTV